jgi:hypothetical protein
MKWWHQTVAGGLELKEAVTQTRSAVEGRVPTDALCAGLRRWSTEAGARKDEALSQLGAKSLPRSLGAAVRGTGEHAGRLPMLSVPMDVIVARNGVDLLIEQLRERPGDPQRNLWLAEALLRVERDVRAYALVRGVLRPRSLVLRAGLRAVARFGQEQDQPPPATRLLGRAFEFAAARLRARGSDPVALQVMARVYLIRDMPEQAIRLAKLAVLSDLARAGEPLVTLARAYAQAGLPRNARRAADLAVDHGQSLGYETLALITRVEHSSRGRRGTQARMDAYAALMQLVRPADRARYEGVAPDRIGTTRSVLAAQWDKTKTTAAQLSALATRKGADDAR